MDVNYAEDQDYDPDMTEQITLTNEMHTIVEPKAEKGHNEAYPEVNYSWNSAWGEVPADADDYFYITWNLFRHCPATQPSKYTWKNLTDIDGQVIGWADALLHDKSLKQSFGSEEKKYETSGFSNENYRYLTVVKYPKSLLKDIPESGLTLRYDATLCVEWKSGYEQEILVPQTYVLHDSEYPVGSFTKDNTDSQNRGITKAGGNEDLVYDSKNVEMRWRAVYDGGSSNSAVLWDEKSGTYIAQPRTIEITDGEPGDVMYSSGTDSAKYVWEPLSGNIALDDNDYRVKKLDVALTEYDSRQNDGIWEGKSKHENTWDYAPVDVYVRYAGSDDWEYFQSYSLSITEAGFNLSITLPDGVSGYKIRHKTSFYSTRLSVQAIFDIKPSSHVVSLVSSDMEKKSTSIFKNKAACKIYDEDGNIFFDATNYMGGNNPANKEIYELVNSTSYQYTYKMADNEENVIFDAEAGIQDNKILIAGWNRNTSYNRVSPMTSGTFYDLLPSGTEVLESTISGRYVSNNNNGYWSPSFNSGELLPKELYNVSFIKNWKDSNRTMMIIKWSAPDDTALTGAIFTYMLRNTYANIIENGTNLENDVAFVNTTPTAPVPSSRTGNQSVISEKELFDSLQNESKNTISLSDVGVRYGSIIRARKKGIQNRNRSDTGNKSKNKEPRTVTSHMRSAHWHHYWIGQGRKQLIVKWIPPVFVCGNNNELPVTIHEVK